MQTAATLQITSVLIYPYWNVNVVAIVQVGQASRFNLSILECKFACFVILHPATRGFNLSILECKYTQLYLASVELPGFNLSILECKSHLIRHPIL